MIVFFKPGKILFFLLFLLTGCFGGQPVSWQDSTIDLVWPEPPETPRIQFLRALSDASDFRSETPSGRVFRWVVGDNDETFPLIAPYGVTADGEGKIWVADAGSGAVHLFDLRRGRLVLITNADGEEFASPVGAAYDSVNRRLYVADSVLGKVFVLDSDGDLLGFRQSPQGFGRPGGIAVDGAGRLYVTDVLKGRVEIFSPAGEHLQSLLSSRSPDGRFNRPSNVAVDRLGRIFVTDSMNFRVEMFTSNGESVGALGALGDMPGSFARPRGVGVDSDGHVYVADAAFDNIQVFDLEGNLLLAFGGAGKQPGQFCLPAGLHVDNHDRLYVVDACNHQVQILQYLGDKSP